MILVFALSGISQAQTTEFIYNGYIEDGGFPATGYYDIEIELYNSLTGGTLLGTNNRNNTLMNNGHFQVVLDYGHGYNGIRYLQVKFRPAGGGPWTYVSPRELIRSVPVAVRSLSVDSADKLGGVPASQFVQTADPRLSDARTPTAGSANYIQNTTSPQTANFNITGTGKAGNIDTGDAGSYFLRGARFATVRCGSEIAIGWYAGNAYNSTGCPDFSVFGNTSIGYFSGRDIALGERNTFVGAWSGVTTTNGSQNSFFGMGSGYVNTGSENSFFGAGTGFSNTTGRGNAFFGSGTGIFNQGLYTGGKNTTGNYNAFFGHRAGQENTTGNVNSFFGNGAGFLNTSGSGNVFLGHDAGNFSVTGSYNVVIGDNADVGHSGLHNATAIGANSYVNGSNSMVLGSIAGVNGALQTVQVGIGTANPFLRLHVVGNSLFTDSTGVIERGLLNVYSASGNANFYMQGSGSGGSRGINFGVDSQTTNARLYIAQYDGTTYLDRIILNPNGAVAIPVLGERGETALCRNSANELSTCAWGRSSGQEGTTLLDQIQKQEKEIASLRAQLEQLKAIMCADKPQLSWCRPEK